MVINEMMNQGIAALIMNFFLCSIEYLISLEKLENQLKVPKSPRRIHASSVNPINIKNLMNRLSVGSVSQSQGSFHFDSVIMRALPEIEESKNFIFCWLGSYRVLFWSRQTTRDTG